MEWLEVFFVSYYFTSLIYYVNHDGSLFSHDYSLWSLAAAPVVSGLIAFLALRPDRLHRDSAHQASDEEPALAAEGGKEPHKVSAWPFLVLLIAAFGLWLALGLALFPNPDQPHSGGGHEAPAQTESPAGGHH